MIEPTQATTAIVPVSASAADGTVQPAYYRTADTNQGARMESGAEYKASHLHGRGRGRGRGRHSSSVDVQGGVATRASIPSRRRGGGARTS